MLTSEYIKSLTLLCVEDNGTTQVFYKSIFENKIDNLICAYDGKDGYEKYLNNKIDIIISDYFMPRLNGLEMIKKIRENDEKIPIILVSDIEDINVIIQALHLNVNNFLKKPLIPDEILQSIENASKILIADKYIEEHKNKRIKELEDDKQYNSYQEELAFSKELNILRNDYYYQMINMDSTYLIDFYYKPLDVLSGDAYSVRKIDEYTTMYLIIDGMGKGLSASLSSMLMTSFVNYKIDLMLDINSFDLDRLIKKSLDYIKPILLEEEALALDIVILNHKLNTMDYAKFAMPVTLMKTEDEEIVRLKSNNPPLSKYTQQFTISSYDISKITKFLFYSDGLVENITKYDEQPYSNYIEADFFNTFTKEDLINTLLEKIDVQEDDISFILLNKLDLNTSLIHAKTFESSLETVDIANDWYSELWSNICDDIKITYNASIVFTEMFMNAYEHGSLSLTHQEKHKLLEEDIYFETLIELEQGCEKKITVEVHKVKYHSQKYIITKISDAGYGFDINSLSKIFRNRHQFNGRGVFVSKNSSSGIYYNSIGNMVIFFHNIGSC